ncbi:MAG: pyruvate dehydrogenase (acetyl-transferring) E1 component subunit alpha [bacterium]
MNTDKEILLKIYKKMKLIRAFEETATELSAKGQVPGFLHLYTGEEAIAAGVCTNLRDEDYITSTHRGHGHLIAKGGDVKQMMAELFGKRTGYCKGKGGSMHICSPEVGILGANGIVAGGIPIATGAGVSINYRESDQVVVCFFGDGATNQGAFHESLNLASIWDLPVVYVCENNLYAISTCQHYHQNIDDIAERAKAYGIQGITIDGNDAEVVYEEAGKAIKAARNGEGPTLLECKTYRWHGHAEGDSCNYRTEEEVQEWKEKDPIPRLEKKLEKEGVLAQDEINNIEQEINEEIEEAVKFGKEGPFPDKSELLEDVYSG